MSKYTMTLEDIGKNYCSVEFMKTIPLSDKDSYNKLLSYMMTLPTSTLLEKTHDYIFDFDYNFYTDDEDKKKEFEDIFISHFINQEIAYETESLWKIKLQAFIKLWMPYYKNVFDNYLTASELKKIREITTTYKGTGYSYNKGTSYNDNKYSGKTSNNQTTSTTQIDSDYPQATFDDNIDFATNSATNSNHTEGWVSPDLNTVDNGKSTSDTDNGNEYKQVVSGYTGDVSSLVEKYNELLTNINNDLLNKAEKALFMKLW